MVASVEVNLSFFEADPVLITFLSLGSFSYNGFFSKDEGAITASSRTILFRLAFNEETAYSSIGLSSLIKSSSRHSASSVAWSSSLISFIA